MTSEIEKLKYRLFEDQKGLLVSNIGISLGSEPATAEAIATQLNHVLDRLETGDFEIVEDYE